MKKGSTKIPSRNPPFKTLSCWLSTADYLPIGYADRVTIILR